MISNNKRFLVFLIVLVSSIFLFKYSPTDVLEQGTMIKESDTMIQQWFNNLDVQKHSTRINGENATLKIKAVFFTRNGNVGGGRPYRKYVLVTENGQIEYGVMYRDSPVTRKWYHVVRTKL